jgi:hypothetical protein
MYKVTVGNKTVVGTNFDAYYIAPRIWFETNGKYGASFSGGRISGANGYAPQSGMNEAGLAFSRLASPTPEKNVVDLSNKKIIPDECSYLKGIMHSCKSIEDVQAYIGQYNHSFFIQDVFIYIEQSGRYLIVEPYTMSIGNDAKYVLANFCPSVTDQAYAHKLDRYHNGTMFLKNKIDTTREFCKALSDTMHVCRKRIGDGTLLTSNWDLKNGLIDLYFYHDYKHVVQYNLKQELAKGDHYFEISKIFPPNLEFQKLLAHKIPQNTPALQMLLALFSALFSFSVPLFLILFLTKRKTKSYAALQFWMLPLLIVMAFYMYSLLRNIGIFYFPAPYKDYIFTIQNIMAYTPFVLLLLMWPLLKANINIIKTKSWNIFSTTLLTVNNIAFLALIALFCYWGLYNIF